MKGPVEVTGAGESQFGSVLAPAAGPRASRRTKTAGPSLTHAHALNINQRAQFPAVRWLVPHPTRHAHAASQSARHVQNAVRVEKSARV